MSLPDDRKLGLEDLKHDLGKSTPIWGLQIRRVPQHRNLRRTGANEAIVRGKV